MKTITRNQSVQGLNQEILNMVKIKMEQETTLRLTFDSKEIRLFNQFCDKLGYAFTINDQKKTIKLFNNETFRYGYIQKLSRKATINRDKEKQKVYITEFWYGYMKKMPDGNTAFVKKYTIDSNLSTFTSLKALKSKDVKESSYIVTSDAQNGLKSIFKTFCGIIELDVTNK